MNLAAGERRLRPNGRAAGALRGAVDYSTRRPLSGAFGRVGQADRIQAFETRRRVLVRSGAVDFRENCPIVFQSVPFLSGRWNTLLENGTVGVPRFVSEVEQGGTKWDIVGHRCWIVDSD